VADAQPTSGGGDRGGAAESEEGDVTPDLLLQHPDATLATFVRRQMKHLKHASETLTKHIKNT
jgi:hypothetical protein